MSPSAKLLVNPVGRCCKCGGVNTAQLHRQTMRSGAEGFTYRCRACDKSDPYKTGTYVGHRAVLTRLTKEEIASLPYIPPSEIVLCSHCGAEGAEWHHFGPKEIFEDSEDWPQAPLCLPCHNLWHKKIEEFYVRRAVYTPSNR